MASSSSSAYENELKVTELRLGLPGTEEEKNPQVSSSKNNKRPIMVETVSKSEEGAVTPPSKSQIVGWPPIRSYRKKSLMKESSCCNGNGIYVKVSMDGAPYLRKIDLKNYMGYSELVKAIEQMFKFAIGAEYSETDGYRGSDYAPTYEDKDGDWMLVGDVPWEMFLNTCNRLRIMKASSSSLLS